METSKRRSENPKEVAGPRNVYTILTKSDKELRAQTKEKEMWGFQRDGVVLCCQVAKS